MAQTSSRIARALVTGASAGLGTEFARQLAARGADLVVVARREDRLRELASELEAGTGVAVEVLAADLADPAQLAGVEQRLRDTSRPVDLLVNNAGFGGYGDFADLSLDEQQAMIDVNVTALVRCSHAVAAGLRGRGHGGIINVASTAGFQPDPYGAVYGATKAFVLSFSQALYEELSRDGVRVTVLAPGVTATEFQQRAGVNGDGLPSAVVMSPESVVRAGLDAFTRGRAVCVPGLGNRIGAWGSEITPSVVARKVSGVVHARFARD